MNILFYYTEAAGLPAFKELNNSDNEPDLIQIVYILADRETGNEIAGASMIVKARENAVFHEEAVRVHGITKEYNQTHGASPIIACEAFMEAAKKADIICGHGVSFDNRIMAIHTARYGDEEWRPTVPIHCTMSIATPIVNLPPSNIMLKAGRTGPKPPTLSECYQHFFNGTLDGAHDGLVYVEACMRIYFHLQSLGKVPA